MRWKIDITRNNLFLNPQFLLFFKVLEHLNRQKRPIKIWEVYLFENIIINKYNE